MQNLTIKAKRVNFETKTLEPVEIKKVVASTKSQNNFVEELKKQDLIINEIIVKDFYLDKSKTLQAVNDFIDSQYQDKELAKSVKEHFAKVLEIGCLFQPIKK